MAGRRAQPGIKVGDETVVAPDSKVKMTEPATGSKAITMPVGVVVRRAPGTTRWARWVWTVTALLPGAGPGNWQVLRQEGEVTEYHAATVPLHLYRADTEAYLTALNGKPPSVFVVMRKPSAAAEARPEVLTVTASAYEAQDYTDNGEDIVERLPMPPGLEAWIGQFVTDHHVQEDFIKRKRTGNRVGEPESGIGDARVRQAADVFRSPRSLRESEE